MSASAVTYERARGAARIKFSVRPDGLTGLTDLYQRAPCRVLFPCPERGDPIQAVLLTTSGGLTGGDSVQIDVEARAGARITVTTQAAEKIYRALPNDRPSEVYIRMTVEAACWAEWLAQETILFNGARLRRGFNAEVSTQGQLLAVESIVLGRTAMGESFDTGFLHDAWRISCGGRLIWADALHMSADIKGLRSARFGFGTAIACSTIAYVGPDTAQQLVAARRLLSESRIVRDSPISMTAGATTLDGLLLIRVLADNAADLRSVVMHLICGIRRSAGGLPSRLPRVWHC